MDNMGKNVQAITAVMVLMLLFAGQASASFKHCFMGCAIDYCIFGELNFICLFKCFSRCLLGVGSSGLDYCKLGCAVDRCAHFVNEFNIEDFDKVDSCVSECEIGECSLLAQAMALPITVSSQELSPTGAPSPR